MNPYGYNEQYMHSQRDPICRDIHLGHSTATMGGQGCYVTNCAYLASRTLGRDVTPLELVTWLNANNGFTSYGGLIWDKIRQFTGGKLWLSSTWNPLGKRFTARLVNYAGTTHMVTELNNPTGGEPICFDPYAWPVSHPSDGFVKPISFFRWGQLLGRFYFKTN